MGQKKSFALRINTKLMEAVEKWAADEFRSTNGQIEWIISQALKDAKRLKSKSTSAHPQKEDKNEPKGC